MIPLIKLISIICEIISYIGLRCMIADWEQEERQKEREKIWQIIKTHEKYKDFRLLDFPGPFESVFVGQTYLPIVQVYLAQCVGEDDIVGFVGKCTLKNSILIPLDGDFYSQNMWIIGYKWFKTDDNEKGLNILVADWQKIHY